MRHSRTLFIVVLAALALAAPAAHAGIPSAANSIVDPCLRVCPAGDMNFHVQVKDIGGNVVIASSVVIDVCGCPGVVLCPLNGGESYSIVAGCNVVMTTNAAGIADFQIRAGGTCTGTVNVYADGVLLRTINAISSPDQDGDLMVAPADQAILAAKFPGPDPTGDFNCSAGMDPGDQAIQAAHLGHSCAVVVPNRPSTWGRVKTIYR